MFHVLKVNTFLEWNDFIHLHSYIIYLFYLFYLFYIFYLFYSQISEFAPLLIYLSTS